MIALYEITTGDGKMPSRVADVRSIEILMRENGYNAPPEQMREMFHPLYGKSIATFLDAKQWCAINLLDNDFPARLEIAGHRVEVSRVQEELSKLLNSSGFGLR